MRKKILCFVIGSTMSSAVFASKDITAAPLENVETATSLALTGTANDIAILEYDLYRSNPQAYYSDHPALKHNGNKIYETHFKKDLLTSFSKFLGPEDAARLLSVNRFSNMHKKTILIMLLPLMYSRLGYNFEDTFAKYDHPAWSPDVLPDETKVKLHYAWFMRAVRLAQRPLTESDPSAPERVLLQFKLFYQAGCLGHMIAAEQAGRMLLTPAYNNAIPAVVTFDDLDPDAKAFDVRRLNKDFLDHKFKELLGPIYEEFDEEWFLSSEGLQTERAPYEKAVLSLHAGYLENEERSAALLELERVIKLKLARYRLIEENSELEEESDSSTDEEGERELLSLIKFLERTGYKTDVNLEFLYQVFASDLFNPYSRKAISREIDMKVLEDGFFDFCKRYFSWETLMLRAKCLTELYEDVSPEDYCSFRNTPEARVALEAQKNYIYIQHLLGDPGILYQGLSEWDLTQQETLDKMSPEEIQVMRLNFIRHRAINAFLGHLKVTRNPTVCWIFNRSPMYGVQDGIVHFVGEHIFLRSNYEHEGVLENSERMTMLKKHYGVGKPEQTDESPGEE